MNAVNETIDTLISQGVLAPVARSLREVKDAEEALNKARIQVNKDLADLPVIFECADSLRISNRDKSYWGNVSEGTIRRLRLAAEGIALGDNVTVDLYEMYKAVNKAMDNKVGTADIRGAIADSETTTEAITKVRALVDGRILKDDVVEAVEGEETEVEASETDKVLRWLTSPLGSLRKVQEAVQGGHVLTAEQAQAFDDLLSVVSGIASARAFVPVKPVTVDA